MGVLIAGCAEEAQVEAAGDTWPVGTVLETMNGGGYTYARVELKDRDLWVAGPVTPLGVGDTVTLVDTMFMGSSFPSKALDRTFDEIIFVMSFQGERAEPAYTQASGVAAQVIATGGYTYVEVEVDGDTFWLAGPETEITQGTRVQWKGPMLMRDFHSASLDRTFSEILFVDSVWMSADVEAGSPSISTPEQS
jgi:hypothetical protein